MSEFENTNLPFLEKDCTEIFGEEQGKMVFGKTLEIYHELTRKADYRNNGHQQGKPRCNVENSLPVKRNQNKRNK